MSRPHVTLKIATSMDGRIALSNGVSQWITNSESRARVHLMRAEHDAPVDGPMHKPLSTLPQRLPLPQLPPDQQRFDTTASYWAQIRWSL